MLTQPVGLVLVGINFELELALVDVLTGFPLPFEVLDKLKVAVAATDFALVLELPLAYGRLSPFFYVHLEDPKAFWNSLAESLASLVLI